MVQILPRARTAGDRLAESIHGAASQAFPAVAQHLMGQQAQEKENETLTNLLGKDVSGLSPDLKKILFEESLKQQTASQKTLSDQFEKQKHLQVASSALNELEGLIGQKGIGLAGSLNFSDTARQNRGVFKSTQAAVLPIFKSLFPRGMTQQEFKTIMAEWIPQANDTESTIQGKIEGLRNLFSKDINELSQEDLIGGPGTLREDKGFFDLPSQEMSAKKRPSLKSFHR